MKVRIAGHSGFCYGVKRAINIAEETLKRSKNKVYSLGPIIHNPQVVNRLSGMGLRVVDNIDRVKKGTVIISSHGAPMELIERMKRKKLDVVDATCPFVRYAQDIVKKLKEEGYDIFIFGDEKHPEVKALLSLSRNRKDKRNTAQRSAKAKDRAIGVITQTTQNKDNYIRGILDILSQDFKELRIFNTICNDTARRQGITRHLLKECDVMIVVGGKNSANTKRLAEICRKAKVRCYHIETEKGLRRIFFKGKNIAGIVSGASTPDDTVKKVVRRIKELTR